MRRVEARSEHHVEFGTRDTVTQTNDTANHVNHVDHDRPTTTPEDAHRGRTKRSRRTLRTRILEPGSVAAARATVESGAVVFPRQGHVRKLVLGVPLAAAATDVVALAGESAFVRGSAADAVVFAAMILIARAVMRQYRPRLALGVLDDLPRSLAATLTGVGLTVAVTAATGRDALDHGELLYRSLYFLALSIVLQAVVFGVIRRLRRRRSSGRRTLIVGAGRVGTTLAAALFEHPELGLTPIGFADPESSTEGRSALPVLSDDMTRLPRTIIDHEIDTTVLAFNGTGDAHVDTIIAVHQTGCNILLVPSMFELHHDGPDVDRVRGIPLLRLRPDPTLRASWWIKRGFDVAMGVLGLIVLAVPLAIVAIVSLIDSGRPLLFWQERIGLDGRPFRLCKFRSMRPASDHESATQWNIARDPRVTAFGRFLRKSSIDEIPQLWNIARGQMSLVGPRPERPTFVQQFSAEHDRYWARHRVPVGLTGLAQVNGLRGDTSIRERARYDNYYIANWSLWLDLKILLLTVREVLGGRGR